MKDNHYLLAWFGRVPEHYALYPLPECKQAAREKTRISVTTEDHKVSIFEFDFRAPRILDISWEDLEESVDHCCETCEWDFCRGKSKAYCPSVAGEHREECSAWELSPSADSLARAEYYRMLHEQHYGKTCIYM